MQSPYPPKRLLYQIELPVTVSQQTDTEVSFLLGVSNGISQASISVSLSNFFLSNTISGSSGLMLQESSFSVSVPYFQPYSPDYIDMGFQRIG